MLKTFFSAIASAPQSKTVWAGLGVGVIQTACKMFGADPSVEAGVLTVWAGLCVVIGAVAKAAGK